MDIYERLGVTKRINGAGLLTRLGGSLMAPEVLNAMRDAAGSFVDMAELQTRASTIIARHTGAEAGIVTSGAAAAITLATAACLTRLDVARMERLPDTEGMPNEVIMFRAHRTGTIMRSAQPAPASSRSASTTEPSGPGFGASKAGKSRLRSGHGRPPSPMRQIRPNNRRWQSSPRWPGSTTFRWSSMPPPNCRPKAISSASSLRVRHWSRIAEAKPFEVRRALAFSAEIRNLWPPR
jgi:hypothetical protein